MKQQKASFAKLVSEICSNIKLFSLTVAPYTGAWIETSLIGALWPNAAVAPYTGAWIETQNQKMGIVGTF